MYLPKLFEVSDPERLREFMQGHPLATLIVADASGLSVDHVPLLLTGDDTSGWSLSGHVARANPLWKKAESSIECLAIFHGPQHYISPNWYATKQENGKVVPTWNYEVVHVRGCLRVVDDAVWMRGFLERLTQMHEANQSMPWQVADAPEDYLAHMLQAVVGLEIEILDMVGKAKVSQNQPLANQHSVLDALRQIDSHDAQQMAHSIQHKKTGD